MSNVKCQCGEDISSYRNGCPTCSAPMCCNKCCREELKLHPTKEIKLDALFDIWFLGSKYSQVVNSPESTKQHCLDGWVARQHQVDSLIKQENANFAAKANAELEIEHWKEMHDAVRWDFARVLKEAELARACCDKLALALVNHKHLWTAEERNAYDKAFEGYESAKQSPLFKLAPQAQQEGKAK